MVFAPKHIIVKILISVIPVFLITGVYSQKQPRPFKAGETLHYNVAYNWQLVWVDAGKVTFQVDSVEFGDEPAYVFEGSGRSLPAYDWFFKVRDVFRSSACAVDFRPFWFSRETKEGSYEVSNYFTFDYQQELIIAKTENTYQLPRIDSVPINNLILDVLTAVYYARNQDFNNFEKNQMIVMDMIIDGEVFDIYGRYRGKEIIENFDGRLYDCHKFSALLVEGTMFKGGEDLFVWLTADKNRIPILIEAKILVGSVKAYFAGGTGLFHPVDALID